MNEIFQTIESSLHNYAKSYTPPDTSIRAVIHQWLTAIIYNTDIFAKSKGVDEKSYDPIF